MSSIPFPPAPILTPCIGVCQMGPDGWCDGCFRTLDEIGQWGMMSDAERQHAMDVVLVEREQARQNASSS